MPKPEPFDPAEYTRAPILSIGSAITLGHTLAETCPKSVPANCKKAAKKLRTTVDAAQAAWADRQRELGAISDEDSRLLDQLADNLWSALRSRLVGYAVLPAADFPKAPRAAELVLTLFGPDGLQFLKDTYPLQFSTMDTLVKRIDEDKLQKEIDELAGAEFLRAIRKVMPRYEIMIRAILKRDGTSGPSLLDHVRAIQRAIVDYATKVSATVDDDEPATAAVAREALRPIANVREQGAPARCTGAGADVAGSPPADPDQGTNEPE